MSNDAESVLIVDLLDDIDAGEAEIARLNEGLALQARITMAPPKVDDAARIGPAKAALKYLLHESGMSKISDRAADAWVQIILAAADAPLKANTCSHSTEGLLDKEIEDHG